MNLKPNEHKRISFNTTIMTSLVFIGPPPKLFGPPINVAPPQIQFFVQVPPNYFDLKFLGPPQKLGGGGGLVGLLPCSCSFVLLNNFDIQRNLIRYVFHYQYLNFFRLELSTLSQTTKVFLAFTKRVVYHFYHKCAIQH